MKRLILLLIFITVSQLIQAQSAWTKKKGEGFTQLSFSSIANYNNQFGSPDYQTERTITDNTIQLYTEYGLTDKTTLIASVPFKILKAGDATFSNTIPITNNGSNNALGNIELGLKHNFYNKKWVISGQLNIEANTGNYDTKTGLRTGYDTWTLTPTLNIGRGFTDFYIQGFTGVNARFNNYSSNFRIGGEAGYKTFKRLWIVAYLDVVSSFKNEKDTNLPIENLLTGTYVNNQEFTAYGLKALLEITQKIGLTASFGGAFSGNNVAKRAAVNFGVYTKF
ncbi:hypothetical protein [Aurantibacter sp.]|uniref:hypothetical protein n=1 Tax=Aurantibacter sp. TaxID=2807103 RepID=UPI0035C7CE92